MQKLFMIFSIFFLLICLTGCRHSQSMCQIVTEVAEQDEKIEYLEKWIDKNVANKDIWGMMDPMGIIQPHLGQDPTMFWRMLNIDWRYLGLAGHGVSLDLALVRFYSLSKENKKNVLTNNVIAISFGVGYRNSIIIMLGKYDPSDSTIFKKKNMRQITKANDRIFVVCSTD